ncbi:MAG TPA: hypothetical protein VNT30_09190 [Stellaceae bacterium]|nr:hypothetical protein [Stellaceae bacterium]
MTESADIVNLLTRIGRSDMVYQEFPVPFSSDEAAAHWHLLQTVNTLTGGTSSAVAGAAQGVDHQVVDRQIGAGARHPVPFDMPTGLPPHRERVSAPTTAPSYVVGNNSMPSDDTSPSEFDNDPLAAVAAAMARVAPHPRRSVADVFPEPPAHTPPEVVSGVFPPAPAEPEWRAAPLRFTPQPRPVFQVGVHQADILRADVFQGDMSQTAPSPRAFAQRIRSATAPQPAPRPVTAPSEPSPVLLGQIFSRLKGDVAPPTGGSTALGAVFDRLR